MGAPLLWHHMAEEGGSPQSRQRPGGTGGRAPGPEDVLPLGGSVGVVPAWLGRA